MLRGQKAARPVQSRLHLVHDKQAAVLPAERLGLLQVLGRGNTNAAFALNRLHDKGSVLLGGKLCCKILQVPERNLLGIGQKWPETLAPKFASH